MRNQTFFSKISIKMRTFVPKRGKKAVICLFFSAASRISIDRKMAAGCENASEVDV